MPARQVGPYRIDGLLGRGGMGEVYRAYDTGHSRVVALKLLPEHLADDREFRERFKRESWIAAQLDEPHVIPIHSYGEVDGRLYLDMRLINGVDLGAVLARDGALGPARAVGIVEQVAQALDCAHGKGLVHRDIKPANILITAAAGWPEFAYVGDFGISRSITSSAVSLTGTGATVGTVDYMAPERFLGRPIDHRVDVYSLACLLHECLTAQRPFPHGEPLAVMYAHVHEPPPRPSWLRPELGGAFDEVVARGLAKDPEQRYPSCQALSVAARSALAGPGSASVALPAFPSPAPSVVGDASTHLDRPDPGAPQRFGWWVAVVAAAVALLLTGVVIVATSTGRLAEVPGAVLPGAQGAPGSGGAEPSGAARRPAGPVAVGADPSGLAISPDGRRAYITDLYGTVSVIDTATHAVTPLVDVDGFLHGIALAPDGSRAYVAAEGTGAVSVIDTATGKVVSSVPVSGGKRWLWGVAVTPDGRRAYVTNRDSGTVSVIDTARNVVAAVITTTGNPVDSPVDMAIAPDGRRGYVTNRGSGTVSVIDIATDAIVGTIQVQGAPNGVAVAPDGRRVYVTNEGSNTVSVIDATTDTVVTNVPVGNAPITVVVTPDGRRAYVVDRGSKGLSVIDTTTGVVVDSIDAGGDPGSIAITPDGQQIYVTNGGSDRVLVIDTVT